MDVKDSCVFYADWLEAAHTIENTALRCCFFEAVLQYALTGMEMETPPELKLAMTIVKNCIDRDRDKYQKKIEKRRAAGRLGGAPIGNQNARKNFDNEEQANQANACLNNQNNQKVTNQADNDNVNDNDNGNVNVNVKDNDFKNTPIPPKGGRFNFFKDFYYRVNKVKVPKRVEEIGYENQYVWRAAEGTPGYMIEVDRMLKDNITDDQAKLMMQTINGGYAPSTEFRALRLAMEMKKLRTTDQRKAVFEELKRSEKEPDIFDTLLEKVEYINQGNKVNSLKGFMQSRRD